jgi:hypothetical protein
VYSSAIRIVCKTFHRPNLHPEILEAAAEESTFNAALAIIDSVQCQSEIGGAHCILGENIMTRELVQKASAEYLRSAQPRLLCRIDPAGNLGVKLTPYISEVNDGWEEVIDEGYDPHHSPLGCPV